MISPSLMVLFQSITFKTNDSIYLLSNLYGNLLDIREWWVEPEEDLSGYITMILTTKSGVEPHWTWTHEILPCLLFTCPPQDLPQTPYLRELPPRRGKLRPRCGECLARKVKVINRAKIVNLRQVSRVCQVSWPAAMTARLAPGKMYALLPWPGL